MARSIADASIVSFVCLTIRVRALRFEESRTEATLARSLAHYF